MNPKKNFDDEPYRARIPADVERPDTLLFGLTVRQAAILAGTGLVLYGAWWATATVVPPPLFLLAAVPVAAAAFVVAVGRRDGIPLDRWLWAAVVHRRRPQRLVRADEPVLPAPPWVTAAAAPMPLPAPLGLPARGISGEGVVDLGPDGSAALVSASTVSFGLRTAAEQNGLVAGFGRWLNSLDASVQILVRAERVDLTAAADRIAEGAVDLPDPALEDAARAHAAFMTDLAAGRELLHRRVTLAVRDPRGPVVAAHRAAEAARALGGCEVTARVLDGPGTAAALAAFLRPDRPPPPGQAAPDAVITPDPNGAHPW